MDETFKKDFERFRNLSYEDFKKLAEDESLSVYQKIGFPEEYRKGKEELIYSDIVAKLGLQGQSNKTILDIGVGCSDLAHHIIGFCRQSNNRLIAVDSEEMLKHLPQEEFIEKHYGYFPDQTIDVVEKYTGKVDAIIAYSIFHYVFYNTCIYRFLDLAVSLLRPGGKILIGDIPNISKRRRFFSSETGIRFHQNFTKTDSLPEVNHLKFEPNQIDDGILMGIVQRYHNFGFEAYILPQPETLPMYNRRDDLLIHKI